MERNYVTVTLCISTERTLIEIPRENNPRVFHGILAQ